ncbi:hypothetical protein TNCV_2651051 [Trichonephila clavipes]|nr:hypothetical protein TNCV_2651051 [Trichonephila clavipes]
MRMIVTDSPLYQERNPNRHAPYHTIFAIEDLKLSGSTVYEDQGLLCPANIRDHWVLRCMSSCPDQVVNLKRDPQCLSPQESLCVWWWCVWCGTHLSTHSSRDERLSQPGQHENRTRTYGVKA